MFVKNRYVSTDVPGEQQLLVVLHVCEKLTFLLMFQENSSYLHEAKEQ